MTAFLICVPAHDGRVSVETMTSVLSLTRFLDHERIGASLITPASTLIHVARNRAATVVLQEPKFSHLLFVDGDINFAPTVIAKMLQFGAPIMGAAYPLKRMDVTERAIDFVGQGGLVLDDAGVPERRGDFVRTRSVGMGLTLIARSALETMQQAYPDLWTHKFRGEGSPGEGRSIFQCFSPMAINQESGLIAGEDISFCVRWLRCNGDIWLLASEEVGHVGRYEYRGRLLDRLTPISSAEA